MCRDKDLTQAANANRDTLSVMEFIINVNCRIFIRLVWLQWVASLQLWYELLPKGIGWTIPCKSTLHRPESVHKPPANSLEIYPQKHPTSVKRKDVSTMINDRLDKWDDAFLTLLLLWFAGIYCGDITRVAIAFQKWPSPTFVSLQYQKRKVLPDCVAPMHWWWMKIHTYRVRVDIKSCLSNICFDRHYLVKKEKLAVWYK